MALAGCSPGSRCRQGVQPNKRGQQLPRGGMVAMVQDGEVGGTGVPASSLPLPRAGKLGEGRNRDPPGTHRSVAPSPPWPG